MKPRVWSRDCRHCPVVWIFDSLVLTEGLGVDRLLAKIAGIGNLLEKYAEKLVFSFSDIAGYRKVGANLNRYGIRYQEWTREQMIEFAGKLFEMNAGR